MMMTITTIAIIIPAIVPPEIECEGPEVELEVWVIVVV
jgi:hypothetical protein